MGAVDDDIGVGSLGQSAMQHAALGLLDLERTHRIHG